MLWSSNAHPPPQTIHLGRGGFFELLEIETRQGLGGTKVPSEKRTPAVRHKATQRKRGEGNEWIWVMVTEPQAQQRE